MKWECRIKVFAGISQNAYLPQVLSQNKLFKNKSKSGERNTGDTGHRRKVKEYKEKCEEGSHDGSGVS